MVIEGDTAHSQQRTIVDFESNVDGRVSRFLPNDSDIRLGMAHLTQPSANCEGDSMKRCWIGWFAEPERELFVFHHFFDLFLRQQSGARILPFRKEREFTDMET